MTGEQINETLLAALEEIEQLKACRAITDQAIASSYGKLRRNWVNGALNDLWACGDAVKELEGEG
jgi:hypothetical protein